MTGEERMMEVAKLRLRLRMNNRLRLESLAMLSRVFREYQEPIPDDLLSTIVFAVPEELMGEAPTTPPSTVSRLAQNLPKTPPKEATVKNPGNPPTHQPGTPPKGPGTPPKG